MMILRQCVAGLLCMLWGISAHAAGFWNLERGASTLGRGGANIASPDDPTAVYINPSAMLTKPGFQMMIDTNNVFDLRSYTAEENSAPLNGNQISQSSSNTWQPYIPSPGFAASYATKNGFAVGAAVYGPLQVYREWDAKGSQRYNEITFKPLQINYVLSAAYALPWWGLRMGISGMLATNKVDTKLRLHGGFGLTGPGDPRYDIETSLDAIDTVSPSGIFSLSAAPVKWLRVSGVFQLGYDVNATGTATLTPQSSLSPVLSNTGDHARVKFSMPHVVRASAMYIDPQNRFDVELAWVWENWSRMKGVHFSSDNIVLHTTLEGTIDGPLQPIYLKYNLQDAWSLRLGGRYDVLPGVVRLRGGIFYETSAARNNYLSAATFDLPKLGVGMGVRWDFWKHMWFDAAVSYAYWFSKKVTDTDVRVSNYAENPPTEVWQTANGTYSNQQIMILLALGFSWLS